MLGVVFYVCSQILEEKVSSAIHLNRGAKIGLRWKKGPVDLMKSAGETEVIRLVTLMSELYQMRIPSSVGKKFWQMESVTIKKNKSVAVITMDEPENMNALSEETMQGLSEKYAEADNDPTIETIFITGSGKAFVAGADIKFFVRNIKTGKISDIETFTAFGQDVFNRIDRSNKKVVAIVNGMALGGGLELALCADRILAFPKAQFAFPETGIGIYPGLGGTQRSAAKIGQGLSKYLIHTGKMLNAKDAEEIGLVDKIITVEDFMEMVEGKKQVPASSEKALPGKWSMIKDFFEDNTLSEIVEKKYSGNALPAEEVEKIVKTIGHKAPVALRLADKLIEEKKGCASELEHLSEIFSTSDALLGLTSIGKKIQYEGK